MAKLLLVVNQADTFYSHRLSWVLGAQKAGYEVHVAGPLWNVAADLESRGLGVHCLDFPRTASKPIGDARALVALVRTLRSVSPDIVHFVTVKLAAYGGPAARAAGVPRAVYSVTGLGTGFHKPGPVGLVYRAILCAGLRVAEGHPRCVFVFQNRDDPAELRRHGLLRGAEIEIIRGSGVDLEVFRPASDAADGTTVVLAARMLWDKGIKEFVEVASRLRTRFPNARFALVGGTDQNPASVPEEVLKRWEREGIVEWWGYRADMPVVLNEAAVVCMPSTYGEGLPKVLLEAAACGRPVVTTDSTGCRDAVDPGVTGYLVPPRDVAALERALEELLGSSERRRQMGVASRDWARSFGSEGVVRGLLDVYASLQ